MVKIKLLPLWIATMISISIILSGCNMLAPAKKPEIGPAGKPVETKPNPPITQRFMSPPGELYDLEATAGVIFEGTNKKNWLEAEAGLTTLKTLWAQAKVLTGDKKGINVADESLEKLTIAIREKKNTDSYESLTQFMSSIGDIGKSYKLSPLSDIIGVGNAIRNVSFYAEDKDWKKAAAKVKELENTWGQAKPSMEKIGILSEVTTTHSSVKQLKDAVDAENSGAVAEHVANLNEYMGRIREYYHGK